MKLNPHILSVENIDWLASLAMNELHGYLVDGAPYSDNGDEWPEMARNIAAQCRQIAKAAMNPETSQSWLSLAEQYEITIREEGGSKVAACKRCGSPLSGHSDPENPTSNRPAGYCSDVACPYSDRRQDEAFTES